MSVAKTARGGPSAAAPAKHRSNPAASTGRRMTARPAGVRRDGRPAFLGWGGHLSKSEKERLKERLALLVLSGVIALAAVLAGGALLTEYVLRGLQPVAKVDGKTVARLGDYAAVFGYRQNNLLAQYQSFSDLTRQPAAGDENAPLASLAQQQLQLIQRQLSSLQIQLVEDFIDAHLIRQEAAKRGLVATPDEVLSELKRQVGYVDPVAPDAASASAPAVEGAEQGQSGAAPAAASPAATPAGGAAARSDGTDFESQMRRYLRALGGSEAVARSDAEAAVLRQKLQTAMGEGMPPVAEQVRARHILVPDETAAKAVQERLKNGESFEALAVELSTDPGSKEQGGDLGWFPRGVMVKEFEEVAFQVVPGQTSDPVKTQFGYHLIRGEERDSQRALEPGMLESLKANALVRWLEAAKKERKVDRFIDSWKIDWAQRHAPRPRAR